MCIKTLTLVSTLALALAFAVPGAIAEPNAEQSGDNSLCADYNAVYLVDGVTSPLAAVVTVAGDTDFVATQSGGADIAVDFYDADGVSVGYSDSGSGKVPASAVTGTICVGALGGYPAVPAAGATWTYQDGF